MPTYLDEAAITGVAPKGVSTVVPPSGAIVLDEAAITGTADFEREAQQGASKVELAKDIGKRALGLTAATGDLLLGVPGSIAGHLMNVGTRLFAAAKGESAKIAGQAGELAEDLGTLTIPGTDVKIPLEGLKSPLQTIMKTALGVEPWNQDIVSKAMESAGKGIEKASAGRITSEDVKLGLGVFMDAAGAAGLKAGAKAITAKPKAKTGAEARATYGEEPPRGEPTLEEAPIPPSEAPFRQQIPEIPTAAEQAKVRKARMKDLKEAFKDTETADYRAFQANEAMESKAADLVKEAEAKGRDTSPYDQAALGEEVSKIINEKPGHERTAEDLIKIREWNRQAFRSQQGRVDPEMLPYIVAGLTGVIGAVPLYNYLKHLGETDPEQRDKDLFGLLGGAALAGAVRVKGSGVWPKEAVARLAEPLFNKVRITDFTLRDLELPDGKLYVEEALRDPAVIKEITQERSIAARTNKMIKDHLNKYFGTAEDPLANIKIPMLGDEVTWGDVADKVVKSASIPKRLEMMKKGEALAGEPIWDIENQSWLQGNIMPLPREQANHFNALQSYLSHVGDYLREFVPPEKLSQYDLVRAIKETAKQDEKQAKAKAKYQADNPGTTTYKEYPDGMKWVEVGKVSGPLPSNWKIEPHEASAFNGPKGFTVFKNGEIWRQTVEGHDAFYNKEKQIRFGRFATKEEADVAIRKEIADQALKDEGDTMQHCVGGYCEAVHQGSSRIFSLRDKKGMSHVTVEVAPNRPPGPTSLAAWNTTWPRFYDMLSDSAKAILDEGANTKGHWTPGRVERAYPDIWKAYKDFYEAEHAAQPSDILQIKGKQNRAPVAAYLPYVQDFVKSGKWGEVGDLQNTGLVRLKEDNAGIKAVRKMLGNREYVTKEEYGDALAQQAGLKPYREPQRGSIDPKLLATLGLAGGGAALGAWVNEDHPIKGAAYGAGIGLLLSRTRPAAWAEAYKRAQQTGSIIRIEDLVRQFGYEGRVLNRSISQMVGKVLAVAKDPARREAIYDYLEGERPTKLSPDERAVAGEVREFLDGLGKVAQEAKVVPRLIEDYVTRIYSQPSQGFLEGIKIGGIRTSSPFGKSRLFKTRADAEAAGFIPKTTDIAQVIQIYAQSVGRAVAGQELVNALKSTTTPEGIPLAAKAGKAPPGYVQAAGEQLRGYLVHPDIAPDVEFIFKAYKPGAILGALDAINSTQKRMGVSLSGFHVTALEQALMGAVSVLKSPGIGLKALGQGFAPAVFGESLAVRMIRKGGQGDAVDFALKNGLEISFEHLGPNIAEERPGMYKGLEVATKFLDETVPGMGRYTTGAVLKLNHMFDEAMWARFQATLKLETFWDRQATLERNNAKLVEAGKLEKMPPRDELARKAASFTNDMFGGLNWYTLVSEMSSRWGRELASAAFSAPGRFGQRMVLFAPDWTISTTRAFTKSFGPLALAASAGAVVGSQVDTSSTVNQWIGGLLGGALGAGAGKALGLKAEVGTGIKGLLRPTELADLHRQYFLRSALLYTAIGDGINYQLSGHHFWENKDWTRIDLGDGRTLQLSKHFMEPIHWLVDPRKQAMGKASFLIKETASQLGDTEYWSPHGAPRMGGTPRGQDIPIGTRLGHAGKQFAPISAQGFELDNPEKALWSMAGMPVYGKTYEERAALKAQQKALRSTPEYKRRAEERKRQRELEKRGR